MPIQTAEFGRTGHASSRIIFGAAALGDVSPAAAGRAFEALLQHGVNHLDVAAGYGDAELRLAPLLRDTRDRFFLATKTGERTAGPAREELHRSLDRLGVDSVDLWQLHNLADPIEWDVALSPGGAIEAAVQAREEGLVRFVGITGHGLQIAATHRRSLDRFPFDSVLAPYNWVTMRNDYYAANFDALQATCAERGVAVQTIKSVARRPWRGREHTRATWYEPFQDQGDLDLSVWWALARAGTHVVSPGDVELLPQVLDAAGRCPGAAPAEEDMRRLAERAETDPLFV